MNLPNRLTLMRIVLVPVYLCLLWFSDFKMGMRIAAFLVFGIASLTDLFDGKIARKYHLVTNFGKFMDPIADKLLTHTAFIMFVALGQLNVLYGIIFIAREFIVSGLRLVAVEQGKVIAAGMSGKVKTVLQMALVLLLTLNIPGNVFSILTTVIGAAAAIMTLYSMIEYVMKNRSVLTESK
ncbi:MAG: CDP-diacylglycerol--glycerol-3-phosphate 3-phosphatidyltransferase [Clostridia bacterium]|nr:CDP-diacylglycerol--glycerol-3-phosphate 3-phosphatidyltransferase [Clostridia bacterium]